MKVYNPIEWNIGVHGGYDNPDDARNIVQPLFDLLNYLNRWCQDQGMNHIIITSGRREAKYNASIGGSPTSYHLTGHAADIAIIGRYNRWEQTMIYNWLHTVFADQLAQVLYHGTGGNYHLHIGIRKGSEGMGPLLETESKSEGIIEEKKPGTNSCNIMNDNIMGYNETIATQIPLDIYKTSYELLQDVTEEEKIDPLIALAQKPGSFKFGACWLTVPPTSIAFTEQNNIVGIPTLRTKGNVYWRTGINSINMDLEFLFPGLIQINDELRHIIAQIKRCPFLPFENYYLHSLIFPELKSAKPQPDIPYEFTTEEKTQHEKQTGTQDRLQQQQWRLKNKKIMDIVKSGDEKSLKEFIEKGKKYGYFIQDAESQEDRRERTEQLEKLYEWMGKYRHIDVDDTSGLSYRDQQMVAAIRSISITSVPGFPKTLQMNCSCDIFNYFPYTSAFSFIENETKNEVPVFNISKSALFGKYYKGMLTRNNAQEFKDAFESTTKLEAIGSDERMDYLHLRYIYSKESKNRAILAQRAILEYIQAIKDFGESYEAAPAAELYQNLFIFLTHPNFGGWQNLFDAPGNVIDAIKELGKDAVIAGKSIIAVVKFYQDSFGEYLLGINANNEIYVIGNRKGREYFLPLKDAIKNPEYRTRLLFYIKDYSVKIRSLQYNQRDLKLGDQNSQIVGISASMETKLVPMNILAFTKPTFQHLGNSEWVVTLTVETSDPNLIRDFRMMTERLNQTALSQIAVLPEIRDYADLSAQIVEGPFFKLLGIENIIPGNFRYSTVEGKPGIFHIQIDFVQSDLELKTYEALQAPAYFPSDFIKSFIKLIPVLLLENISSKLEADWNNYHIIHKYKIGMQLLHQTLENYPKWSKFLFYLCKPIPKSLCSESIPVYKFILNDISSELIAKKQQKDLFKWDWKDILMYAGAYFTARLGAGPGPVGDVRAHSGAMAAKFTFTNLLNTTIFAAYKGAVGRQLKATLNEAINRENVPSELKIDSTENGRKLLELIRENQKYLHIRNSTYPDLELPIIADSPDFWFFREPLYNDNIREFADVIVSGHEDIVLKLAKLNSMNKQGKATTQLAKLDQIAKEAKIKEVLVSEELNKNLLSYLRDANEDLQFNIERSKDLKENAHLMMETKRNKSQEYSGRADESTLRSRLSRIKHDMEYYNDSLKIINLIELKNMDFQTTGDLLDIALVLAKNWGICTPRDAQLEKQMLQDAMNLDENKTLRLGRAFPTFKLYFIEKDKEEWLLFDDFYGYGAVKEIQIRKIRKSPIHTAVVTLSNITNVLQDIHAPKNENISKSETAEEQPNIDTMLLQEGCEIMIKMGYENDSNKLKVVFQGSIVSIQPGPELQFIAQGWGAELGQPIQDFSVGKWSTIRDFGDIATAILNKVSGLRHFGTTYNLAEMFDDLPNIQYRSDRRETYVGRLKNWSLQGLGLNPLLDHRDDNVWLPYHSPPSIWSLAHIIEGKGFAFDWRVYNKTAWDALDEVLKYMPGYIMKILPYNEDNLQSARCTLYIGPRDGYYMATDDSEVVNRTSEHDKYQERRNRWYMRVKGIKAPTKQELIIKLRNFNIDYDSNTSIIYKEFINQNIICQNDECSLMKASPFNPTVVQWSGQLYTMEILFGGNEICHKINKEHWKRQYFNVLNGSGMTRAIMIYDVYDKLHFKDFERVYGKASLFERATEGVERFTYGKDDNPKRLAGKRGWKRACKTHFIDSYHHIIENNMKASRENMYNKVHLIYPKGEPQMAANETQLKTGDLSEFEMLADDNIKPDMIRTHKLFFTNIDVDRTRNFIDSIGNVLKGLGQTIGLNDRGNFPDIPPYAIVANTILAEDLKDMYDGEIIILLDPNIDIHDVVYIYDDVNEIYGPVGVKEIYHYFSMAHGAYTVIVPDLMSYPSNLEQTVELGYASALYAALIKIVLGGILIGGGGALLAGNLLGPWTGVGVAGFSLAFTYKLASSIGSGGINKLMGREGSEFVPIWRKGAPFLAGMDGYRKDDLIVHYMDKITRISGTFKQLSASLIGLRDKPEGTQMALPILGYKNENLIF